MAEIGLGYGSEFQLMRFLGHHRNELYKLIHEATHTSEPIEWMDYPYENERISGDGELKGIECFSTLNNYAEIEAAWKRFWPQSGSAMNWDGVFKIGDTWFFVEAKAHEKESYQKCSASSEDSKKTISDAFCETQQWLKANSSKPWIETNCYQLANRLAFLFFCKEQGIKAKLLYIGFVKGFRRKLDELHSGEEWLAVWKEELCTLGLNIDEMEPYISFIHPDCEEHRLI